MLCPVCGVNAPGQTAIRPQGLVRLCGNVACRAMLGSAEDEEAPSPRPEGAILAPRAGQRRSVESSEDEAADDVSFSDLPERRDPMARPPPPKKACIHPTKSASGEPPLDVLRAARLRVKWLRAELKSHASLEKELRYLERLLKAARTEPAGKVVPMRRNTGA